MSVLNINRSVFSPRFGIRHLNDVFSNLAEYDPITFLSFSGLGLSTFFRFLSTQDFSNTRFNRLSIYKFIYFDFPYYQPYTNKDIQHSILKCILRNLNIEDDKFLNSSFVSLNDLINRLEKIINSNSKRIYLIMDNISYLFKEEYIPTLDFLAFLRDHFMGKIEYIFGSSNLNDFENISKVNTGSLKRLFFHKVVYIKKLNREETRDLVEYNSFIRIKDRLLKIMDATYNSRLKKIMYLAGGYAPYVLTLKSYKDLDHLDLSWDKLHISSKRIFDSLTERCRNVCKNIILKQKIEDKSSIVLLKSLGVLEDREGKLEFFSPIFLQYLKNTFLKSQVPNQNSHVINIEHSLRAFF